MTNLPCIAEIQHYILDRRHLPNDGSHEGWPWDLNCQSREVVPACAGFWLQPTP